MGAFNFSAPILAIDSTSDGDLPLLSLVPFRTLYLSDPWTLPSSVESGEGHSPVGVDMSLSVAQISY